MNRATPLAAAGFALAAVAFAPAASAAQPSSASEMRGYNNCLQAAAEQGMEANPGRTYFLKETGERNHYFINGYAWQDGTRVPLRIACETSANGRALVNVEFAQGRYSNRSRSVAVATN